jgi:hypothetical protein
MEEAVKNFALKKMAELFKNHKKRLHSLVKKKKTPDFNAGHEKVKDHWAKFVKYPRFLACSSGVWPTRQRSFRL